MYAQLIEGGTTPERRTEMDRIVTDELVPALQDEPGYSGALNLTDSSSGNALMIILWQNQMQAQRALSEYKPAFLKALANIAAISTGTRNPISTWNVNYDDRSPAATIAAMAAVGVGRAA
jgi:hypothetical protein